MKKTYFKGKDILANVIHADHGALIVLERLNIKLGFANKTIQEVSEENDLNTNAVLTILNLFCFPEFRPTDDLDFNCIPNFLKYLKHSHQYFLEDKILGIQENMRLLVEQLQDSKANMVESFFQEYIGEIVEHIEYENETVFPFIEEIYDIFNKKRDGTLLLKEYDINIYEEHHDDIELSLRDLKNILIRHLPQVESGNIRGMVLRELFELEESQWLDLSSNWTAINNLAIEIQTIDGILATTPIAL